MLRFETTDAEGRRISGYDERRTPEELADHLHDLRCTGTILSEGQVVAEIDESGTWVDPDFRTLDPQAAGRGDDRGPSRKPAGRDNDAVRLSPQIRADIARVRAERRAAAAHEAQRREQQREQARSRQRERGRER